MQNVIFETKIESLERIHQGKVRDIYAIDAEHMLIIATDRISAFDVVLPTPIPNKGAVLKSVSDFWLERTSAMVKNHSADIDLSDVLTGDEYARYKAHAVIVKRMDALPIEAIIRGYIIGSGWKDYQKTGGICGIDLPAGLKLADKLATPIYTPSTKADVGDHDENISYDETVKLLGVDMAKQVKAVSLQIYTTAYNYAIERGIIIADTKLEFGVDKAGDLVLIDEVLTPDSSRFWDKCVYVPGENPASYDKQFVRDYLEGLDWNKEAPGPELPAEIVNKTASLYADAKVKLGIR